MKICIFFFAFAIILVVASARHIGAHDDPEAVEGGDQHNFQAVMKKAGKARKMANKFRSDQELEKFRTEMRQNFNGNTEWFKAIATNMDMLKQQLDAILIGVGTLHEIGTSAMKIMSGSR